MKFVFALAALSVLALAPAANADDVSMKDCTALSKQVNAALETAKPGDNTSAARIEANSGRSMCTIRLYAQGVAHFNKALELLAKG
jgi:hypothetical protein